MEIQEEKSPRFSVGSGRKRWRGIFLEALLFHDDAGFETWEEGRRGVGQFADDWMSPLPRPPYGTKCRMAGVA